MDIIFQISSMVENIIMGEAPASILEISAYDSCFGRLFAGCQKRMGNEKYVIDRIVLNDADPGSPDHVYTNIFPLDLLERVDSMQNYDFIFIAHLFENVHPDVALGLLEKLQYKITKQILIITPEYPNDPRRNGKSNIRKYHPITFLDFDFSYYMYESPGNNWQFYSIFKKQNHDFLNIDLLPQNRVDKKQLRVAVVMPGKYLAGGAKALLHFMKHLTRKGHIVKAYLRSDTDSRVIPDWSELTDSDIHEQIIVPSNSLFLEYIRDVDIIIAGLALMLPEFKNSPLPVALWEQGSEMTYGDFYGRLIFSNDTIRKELSDVYRLPVYLLAVSETIRKALKGKYNRDSQLFPACVDVDFYRPGNKNNTTPVILIVGHPMLKFKRFNFALHVLETAWNSGCRFKVHWACQADPRLSNISFPIECFVMASQEKLASLYREADIFISTSLYESFPLPPIEAIASGTAVVAVDSGGIRTYAAHGKNCLLVEQGDATSMVRAIRYLLDHPERRESLAKAGRATALDYSFERVTERLEECINKIVYSHANR